MRTAAQNRLRWHLVQLAPEIEAGLAPASLDHPQVRARVARRLARLARGPHVRVAKLILKRIGLITLEERELRAELKALIEAHCPALLAEHGLTDHRRDHHRPHRWRQTIPDRLLLRSPPRRRADPGQLRQHTTPPSAPRR